MALGTGMSSAEARSIGRPRLQTSSRIPNGVRKERKPWGRAPKSRRTVPRVSTSHARERKTCGIFDEHTPLPRLRAKHSDDNCEWLR